MSDRKTFRKCTACGYVSNYPFDSIKTYSGDVCPVCSKKEFEEGRLP